MSTKLAHLLSLFLPVVLFSVLLLLLWFRVLVTHRWCKETLQDYEERCKTLKQDRDRWEEVAKNAEQVLKTFRKYTCHNTSCGILLPTRAIHCPRCGTRREA